VLLLKGKYFLDKLNKIVYSTNSYTLWNFYHNICYGKPFPGEISRYIPGPGSDCGPDWNIITVNGIITHRLIDGKYKEVF
jgi:hypothetical protein